MFHYTRAGAFYCKSFSTSGRNQRGAGQRRNIAPNGISLGPPETGPSLAPAANRFLLIQGRQCRTKPR